MQRFSGLIVALALVLGGANASRAEDQLLVTILAEDDVDGDGLLARDEAPVSILLYFDRADSDGNGSIDSFEANAFDAKRLAGPQSPRQPATEPAARPPVAPAVSPPDQRSRAAAATARGMIERLDRNGDDQLSRDEFPPQHREQFGKFDLDGNGTFDLKEADVIDARRRDAANATEERGPRGGRTVARTVELMDTNGDGLLQKREAPLQLQRSFERFDTNGDGAIDMQEARTPRKSAEEP